MPYIKSRQLSLAINQAFDGTLGQWNREFRDAVNVEEQTDIPNSITAQQVGPTATDDFWVEVRVNFQARRIRGRLHYLAPGQRDPDTPISVDTIDH